VKFRHMENILQNHRQGLALSMHVNGNVTDTSGLNGTVVAEDDIHGGGKSGVMMEPVMVCTHIARGARVDDPTSLKVLRAGIDLGL